METRSMKKKRLAQNTKELVNEPKETKTNKPIDWFDEKEAKMHEMVMGTFEGMFR